MPISLFWPLINHYTMMVVTFFINQNISVVWNFFEDLYSFNQFTAQKQKIWGLFVPFGHLFHALTSSNSIQA